MDRGELDDGRIEAQRLQTGPIEHGPEAADGQVDQAGINREVAKGAAAMLPGPQQPPGGDQGRRSQIRRGEQGGSSALWSQ